MLLIISPSLFGIRDGVLCSCLLVSCFLLLLIHALCTMSPICLEIVLDLIGLLNWTGDFCDAVCLIDDD